MKCMLCDVELEIIGDKLARCPCCYKEFLLVGRNVGRSLPPSPFDR